MLPDFPELKDELEKLLVAKVRSKVSQKDPLLSSIRRFVQHEGKVHRYEQLPTGEMMEEGYQKYSAEIVTTIAEVPMLVGPKLDEKLDALASQIVSQTSKAFFEKVGKTSDQAGTSVDAKGQAISPELLLQVMERVLMDFDSNGNPTTTWVIHPDSAPAFQEVANQIDNDPELRQRHERILRQQRTAWIARENNRKLVD